MDDDEGPSGPGEGPNPRRRIPADLIFSEWQAQDGWRLRRFVRPPKSPPIGDLLFLGGRADFVEKYLEAIDHWSASGWRVSGFDWRGQGGSGRLRPGVHVGHLESFDPLIDDLQDYVAEWKRASAGPHVVVAHSMGAHLLVRLLAERRATLDAAVLLAPMFGLPRSPLPSPALPAVVAAAVALGLGDRPLWRRDPGNVGDRLTACPYRHADKLWWKATKPEIATGPPSWGWLRSAIRSIRRLTASPGLAGIATPLLILCSERDVVIDVAAVRAAARRIPSAELVLLPGRGHELLREADACRVAVMGRIDVFLAPLTNRARR